MDLQYVLLPSVCRVRGVAILISLSRAVAISQRPTTVDSLGGSEMAIYGLGRRGGGPSGRQSGGGRGAVNRAALGPVLSVGYLLIGGSGSRGRPAVIGRRSVSETQRRAAVLHFASAVSQAVGRSLQGRAVDWAARKAATASGGGGFSRAAGEV